MEPNGDSSTSTVSQFSRQSLALRQTLAMAQSKEFTDSTPAARGYRMPAEWEKHEATWLGWPHETSDWPGKMPAIRWVYGEMIRKIAAGERVRLCVNSKADQSLADYTIKASGGDPKQIDYVPFHTNR